MKTCAYCKKTKSLSDFWAARQGQYSSRCKECHGLAPRACNVCGAVFIGKSNVKACSDVCSRALRPQTFKECECCGRTFGPVSRLSQKFCSNECKAEKQRGNAPWNKGVSAPQLYRAESRKCPVCGDAFRAVSDYGAKKQIYCSHRCYLKNRRVSEPERIAGEWLSRIGILIEPQKKIGKWCFDYFIPSALIVVEIDGAFWHSSEKVKERDKRKDDAVADMGYAMIRVDAEAVRKNPSIALHPVAKMWLEASGATFAQVAEDKTNANAVA